MPPSRRHAHHHSMPPPAEANDTDSEIDVTGLTGREEDDDGQTIGDELVALEDEEDLDDEDALGKST